MIAGTLKGIISQRLVPTPAGHGRVATCEVLVMTGRVKDMIVDPQQTGRLPEVVAEGEFYGMQTFDQALLKHLQAGRVTMADAMRAATSPHDFKLLVASDGRRSTSMEDVQESREPVGATKDNGHGGVPVASHAPPPRRPSPPPAPGGPATRPSTPPPG